jgi:thiol-disulfide isomerase/thioredoxin
MRRSLALVLALALAAPLAVAGADDAESPMFPNLTLATLDGGEVRMDAFRGRPVLLTFWASWCGPCRVELPELETLYGELAGTGFVVLTVNVDRSPEAARRFMAATKVDLPIYRLPTSVLDALGIDSLPTNVLIDPEGRAELVVRGYSRQMPDQIRQRVREMIAGDGA